jgi:hypothetical protein
MSGVGQAGRMRCDQRERVAIGLRLRIRSLGVVLIGLHRIHLRQERMPGDPSEGSLSSYCGNAVRSFAAG